MSEYPRGVAEETPVRPFLLDRIAAGGYALECVVGFVLAVLGIARGYAKAQDMGTVGPFGYAASSWWFYAHFVLGRAYEVWVFAGLLRSRQWAIVLLLIGSAQYLITNVHAGDVPRLVIHALFAAYALVRVLGWLGPRTKDLLSLGAG